MDEKIQQQAENIQLSTKASEYFFKHIDLLWCQVIFKSQMHCYVYLNGGYALLFLY